MGKKKKPDKAKKATENEGAGIDKREKSTVQLDENGEPIEGKPRRGKSKSEIKLAKSQTYSYTKVAQMVKSDSDSSYTEGSSEESSEEELRKEQERKLRLAKQEEEAKKAKAKKGKGKKGKKKEEKAEKVEEAAEPAVEEDDIMAEVMRMKAAAAAPPVLEEAEEVVPVEKPKKPKKAGGKKKGKKVKLTAEMIEKLRIEAELEAARLAEEERIRLEEERKAAIEKERREIIEEQMRVDQLEKSCRLTEDIVNHNKGLAREEKANSDWQLYIECGELPNASLCNMMNTYLHLWEKAMDETTMNDVSRRTSHVIKLTSDLEDLLDNFPDEPVRTIENWKWIRQLFRDEQKQSLEVATYRLLRDVEKNLHRIDIPTADFDFKDDYVSFSLWLRVQLPIPLPNPRRPPKTRLDIKFPNVNMDVFFPITIDCENMAIRAMYLKYDHLSDLSEIFYIPEVPSQLIAELPEITRKEWRVKLKYKYDNRDIRPKKKKSVEVAPEEGAPNEPEEEEEEEEEKVDFASDEEIPIVPYKKLEITASEVAISLEDTFYDDTGKAFALELPDYVINLRKFTILGGVYHLNLLYQPPQPQDFITMELNITALYLPKRLEHVPFTIDYQPPEPPEPGVVRTPEEIDADMKQLEEDMDKLMLITITWPTHVLFIELPIVCHWDEDDKVWSKKEIYDLKHNEEKGMLSFRTGVFGVFGLATIRYSNLPFQAWEIRPEEDGTVTMQITAAILILEFNIKGGLICVTQLQNSPNKSLKNLIGIYFQFHKLKRIMKETGIDIFPEHDAFCYIEGACEKHWPMERHLYYNMAELCNTFNFAWSRWNVSAGRRSIVMQMREYTPNKPKQKNYSMLLVTPLKASYIDCTEVSQVFCEDEVEQVKFSADLYNLMKATCSITLRKRVESVPWQVVYVLSRLLISTRVLSFS